LGDRGVSVELVHQPNEPPSWWDPLQLESSAPEAAQLPAANTEPVDLPTSSDPAEPLPAGRTSGEEVGRDGQNAALRWRGVLNALAAIGRFFIRFFGGV
jgi:hypothetical protein